MTRQCKRCLGPLAPHGIWGICRRNPDCRLAAEHAAQRAYRARHRPPHPACQLCGKELALAPRRTIFICVTLGRCRREYMRQYAIRWRRDRPDANRASVDRARHNRRMNRAEYNARRRAYYRRYSAVLRANGLRWDHRPIRDLNRSRAQVDRFARTRAEASA